ncbi:HEAT repeat domain-containing protein [Streptomyces sp. 549]|uniref:HEAT repeat domain-containing protein n=1 Tax=Streptomyces sp. 549 TaxID=3049076 RepID=UPI0024C457DF|nr:HEAT repeat domain-containing protein [Streptomyces sp. 549]MDK1472140.1 HEAT repeat domain-containing protein [Streptomyces sp. 549]
MDYTSGMDDDAYARLDLLARRLPGPAERTEATRLVGLVRQADEDARRAGGGTGPDGPPSAAREELAAVLAEPGRPLWARRLVSYALARLGDRRAFETLVFLLNYRDPACGAVAAEALVRLGDPRTARAAAALAANGLRSAYALHPVRLLAELDAPESVPALIDTLRRLLAGPDHHWPVALACTEGLGRLGDPRAREVLLEAREHTRLRNAAGAALRGL